MKRSLPTYSGITTPRKNSRAVGKGAALLALVLALLALKHAACSVAKRVPVPPRDSTLFEVASDAAREALEGLW